MKKTPARDQKQPPAINLPERIEQLSAKRQEVIRPILEHPREYVLLSVRAIAKRLHTDPATVVRIVRGLGFSSYRDFSTICTSSPSRSRRHWTPCKTAAVMPTCPPMSAILSVKI